MRSASALLLFFACASARAGSPSLPTSATHEVTVLPAPVDPVRGPRFAPVTLDVWVQLGHVPSLQASEAARRAVERAPLGDVREVLHLLPWGPPSCDLAVWAAAEAQAEDRFWPFLDRLLAERSVSFTVTDLQRLGREVGLDAARLDAHLAAFKPRSLAERLLAEARAHDSPGRISVNGVRIVGLANDEAIANTIADARPAARALLDDGVPLGHLYERLVEEAQKNALPQEPPAAKVQRPRVPVDVAGAPSRGPSLAPVTVVLFANLSTPSCLELASQVRRAADAHPGQVRLVWRHWYPPYAPPAPLHVPAAAEAQGRFWALFDRLVPAHGRPFVAAQAGDLEREAEKAGVDRARMLRDQQSGALKAIIDRDRADVERLRLLYSPAVLVNGVVLTGLQSADMLEVLITEELSRGVLDRLKQP
jgi:protein-disulfide isomerase